MSSQSVVHSFSDGKIVVFVVETFNYDQPMIWGVFSTLELAEACAKRQQSANVREYVLNESI